MTRDLLAILPVEVRYMIYGYLLPVGKIFPYIRRTNPERIAELEKYYHDTPHLGICQVNRTIRAEAEPVLYQKNMLILPLAEYSNKFFTRCLYSAERRAWIRSVAVTLEYDDLTSEDRAVVVRQQNQVINGMCMFPEINMRTGLEMKLTMHDHLTNYMVSVVWPRKVAPILDHMKLDVLELRFRKSRCIARTSCVLKSCRQTTERQAIEAFKRGFALGLPSNRIIRGLEFESKRAFEDDFGLWTDQRIRASRGIVSSSAST